jgi:CDP-diacylglycerol--serine O-phosphatidyltransferase
MDPVVPRLEEETLRRRRRLLFRHSRVPVRMMVPNFFTLLGLCAGLTSIRMSIEGRFELALGLIVFAALVDGIDGRVARLLKASSRFGAELDSLADFVDFGVAPAFLIFTWGLSAPKSLGWIAVMIFALAAALRLARFNVATEEVKPKWQSDYFTGMPTPAAAVVVLLPVYLDQLGVDGLRAGAGFKAVLVYVLAIAFLMVSTIPTYSGKLLGERVSRDMVLPLFMLAVALVALLLTYPFATLTGLTLAYLAGIPFGWMRFRARLRQDAEAAAAEASGPLSGQTPVHEAAAAPAAGAPAGAERPRVVEIRPGDGKR